MARYLDDSHRRYTINHGKQIEQFMGGIALGDVQCVRYLSIRKDKQDRILLAVHDLIDSGDSEHCDLSVFEYFDLPEDRWEPRGEIFTTIDDALASAESNHGASISRWVSQNVVESEYRDYKQKQSEQTDAANRHPFGTSGMAPANPAARAGAMPEASGDS